VVFYSFFSSRSDKKEEKKEGKSFLYRLISNIHKNEIQVETRLRLVCRKKKKKKNFFLKSKVNRLKRTEEEKKLIQSKFHLDFVYKDKDIDVNYVDRRFDIVEPGRNSCEQRSNKSNLDSNVRENRIFDTLRSLKFRRLASKKKLRFR